MNKLKLAIALGCIALMGAASQSAKADEWDKKAIVTFNVPVEIPGVHLKGWGVLPPGTYVFKLMDSTSDRNIVQILNKDETTIYATVLAIPDSRLQATDKTVITFSERPVGEPEALRAWFHPGSKSGEEFVYPKARALELAKVAKTPVFFTPAEIPLEVSEPIKPADEPTVAALKQAPVLTVQPSGEEVQMARLTSPPVQILPATASSTPLIGLLGIMALAAAFTPWFARKRSDGCARD